MMGFIMFLECKDALLYVLLAEIFSPYHFFFFFTYFFFIILISCEVFLEVLKQVITIWYHITSVGGWLKFFN